MAFQYQTASWIRSRRLTCFIASRCSRCDGRNLANHLSWVVYARICMTISIDQNGGAGFLKHWRYVQNILARCRGITRCYVAVGKVVDVEVELVVSTFTLGKMSNLVPSIEGVEASYANLQHLTIFNRNVSTAGSLKMLYFLPFFRWFLLQVKFQQRQLNSLRVFLTPVNLATGHGCDCRSWKWLCSEVWWVGGFRVCRWGWKFPTNLLGRNTFVNWLPPGN